MATLLELAKDIVAAHAATNNLTPKELISELQDVYAALQAIEKGETISTSSTAEEQTAPAVSKRKAFGKDKITCMICGKQMKTLARHLGAEHDMKPSEYRSQFDIPRTQPLAAKNYSESRRQMAQERDLGANLAKARAARGKAKEQPAAKKGVRKASPRKKATASATE